MGHQRGKGHESAASIRGSHSADLKHPWWNPPLVAASCIISPAAIAIGLERMFNVATAQAFYLLFGNYFEANIEASMRADNVGHLRLLVAPIASKGSRCWRASRVGTPRVATPIPRFLGLVSSTVAVLA